MVSEQKQGGSNNTHIVFTPNTFPFHRLIDLYSLNGPLHFDPLHSRGHELMAHNMRSMQYQLTMLENVFSNKIPISVSNIEQIHILFQNVPPHHMLILVYPAACYEQFVMKLR